MTRTAAYVYGIYCGLQPPSGIHWSHPKECNGVQHLEKHSAKRKQPAIESEVFFFKYSQYSHSCILRASNPTVLYTVTTVLKYRI